MSDHRIHIDVPRSVIDSALKTAEYNQPSTPSWADDVSQPGRGYVRDPWWQVQIDMDAHDLDIEAGLELLWEAAPADFCRFVSGDFDAALLDRFIQFATFGEIVYV